MNNNDNEKEKSTVIMYTSKHCIWCGSMACATCHVYVDKKWFEKLKKKDEGEEDMLDMAYQPNKFSRLSCQLIVSNELDGLILRMPSKQG